VGIQPFGTGFEPGLITAKGGVHETGAFSFNGNAPLEDSILYANCDLVLSADPKRRRLREGLSFSERCLGKGQLIRAGIREAVCGLHGLRRIIFCAKFRVAEYHPSLVQGGVQTVGLVSVLEMPSIAIAEAVSVFDLIWRRGGTDAEQLVKVRVFRCLGLLGPCGVQPQEILCVLLKGFLQNRQVREDPDGLVLKLGVGLLGLGPNSPLLKCALARLVVGLGLQAQVAVGRIVLLGSEKGTEAFLLVRTHGF
jgi:hypothetical protein